ncbi:MAG: aminotransferase [Bacteroidetes bacterium]|nr:aminotransferase [Bacteroidota bacterium]
MPNTVVKSPWELDRDHVFHPYTNFLHFHKEGTTIFTRAQGHHIEDIDGNRYLDGMAGLWCVNIGHGNRELADYIGNQAAELAYFNTFENAGSVPAAQLAAKLAELAPGDLNHTFFGTGGSMANDTAIKLVHYYFNILGKPQKKKIISRELGYHGSTYLAHTLTGIAWSQIGFDLVPDLVHYVSAPYQYRNGDGLTEAEFCDTLIAELEQKILDLGPDNVACFIAEPIMGAGGVIVPPQGYQRRTWEVCQKYDVLYISDEVVTAFGRLGHMVTSQDLFGFQPDILVMAKGISSGYIPLGATMISDRMYEVLRTPKKENPNFTHGFTYSGHPVACAAGVKNIEIMERMDLCGNVLRLGPYFEAQLQALSEYEIVGEVRGSHFMMCLELVRDKATKAIFGEDVDVTKRVYRHCKKRGLMMRPIGSLCVFSPPLTFDKAAIDETVTIVKDSLEATIADLKREGHV